VRYRPITTAPYCNFRGVGHCRTCEQSTSQGCGVSTLIGNRTTATTERHIGDTRNLSQVSLHLNSNKVLLVTYIQQQQNIDEGHAIICNVLAGESNAGEVSVTQDHSEEATCYAV